MKSTWLQPPSNAVTFVKLSHILGHGIWGLEGVCVRACVGVGGGKWWGGSSPPRYMSLRLFLEKWNINSLIKMPWISNNRRKMKCDCLLIWIDNSKNILRNINKIVMVVSNLVVSRWKSIASTILCSKNFKEDMVSYSCLCTYWRSSVNDTVFCLK